MTSAVQQLSPHFAAQREKINQTLERLLPPATQFPQSIHEAMRYSIFAGGKRVRPILVLESGQAFGGHTETLLEAGAAVEMIHTYSLIHDDLPAMDDDSLRRGMPTSHVKFGEATAILAGDALLTLAFQILSSLKAEAMLVLRSMQMLTAALGTNDGMIAGQVMDLEYEGAILEQPTLERLHSAKTGALIRACVMLGALLAGGDDASLETLFRFGSKLGLVFQIVDDVLDVEASSGQLGKTAGKDQRAKKYTFPAALGLGGSKQYAQRLTAEAIADLETLPVDVSKLKEFCLFLVQRRS
ncbi:MAG TPA: farnesyl diphosphate synthase [Acidobacteriota bacterium]|jgi:geranylgeranyl diphosphate synthase type II|nr:farnesyl diphosphate synthase [Acidobacteriota bacterium]